MPEALFNEFIEYLFKRSEFNPIPPNGFVGLFTNDYVGCKAYKVYKVCNEVVALLVVALIVECDLDFFIGTIPFFFCSSSNKALSLLASIFLKYALPLALFAKALISLN